LQNLFLRTRHYIVLNFVHEAANCLNPYKPSKWDPIRLHYKHTSCTNVVSTNNCLSLYFCKDMTCFNVGLYDRHFLFPVKWCDVWLRQVVVKRENCFCFQNSIQRGWWVWSRRLWSTSKWRLLQFSPNPMPFLFTTTFTSVIT